MATVIGKESLNPWQRVFLALANGVSGVLAMKAVYWLKARSWTVRQLQAAWLESGQKRTRYSFFFTTRIAGFKVHTMSYSVLLL